MFADYIQHGWKLCRIELGTKSPRYKGWNREDANIGDLKTLVGAGLLHSYSGTCALDVDDFEKSVFFLNQHGVNLLALVSAPDAVQIVSGRPNRAKLLYALPEPLPSKSWGYFELRSGATTGRSAQDVLPPTIHPDTGKPYEWRGDWHHLPPLPESLKALWLSEISLPGGDIGPGESIRSTRDLIVMRDLLSRKSPDCGYDEWIRAGMACHHESGGSDEGFALWDSWSAPSNKYPGVNSLRSHWVSFGNAANPVTADSLRKIDVAAISEFEDLSAVKPDWLEQATADDKPAPPTYKFLTLAELFDRPTPDWLIEGVLPDAGVGSFYGQPGGGKTFLAVGIALDVALGLPWRGFDVKAGPVLYIAAEDDRGVQVRLAAGLAARGVQEAAVRVLPAAPVFTDPKQSGPLLTAIKALGRQSLVFIDTLAAVTPGSDENAAKDMSTLIHFCQKIHKVTGGLVLLIHHEGKTTGRGPRGWSGLHGAFDVEWEVTDQESHREMRISKLKNAPTGKVYEFGLIPFADSCIVEWL